MSGLRRTIHPQANFDWLPLAEVAPEIAVSPQPRAENGEAPERPYALVFTDADDREQHVYIFSAEGRQNLVRTLTGGIVLPGGPSG